MQDDVFIAVGFKSTAISMLLPLKHIYGGSFMSRRYMTPQKSIPIAAAPKNTAIDPMYSNGPIKHRNRRHIAAFFAPTAIVQISFNVGLSQVACDIIFLCLDRVNLTLLVVTFRH